jgi:hypothetical protein
VEGPSRWEERIERGAAADVTSSWVALAASAIVALLAAGCSDAGTPDAPPFRGNGTCDWGENVLTCPADCVECGNGTCDPGEDTASCPHDCFCGNGACDPGEEVASCSQDCHCGNWTCGPGEDAANCPHDCSCGNGTCDSDEDYSSCPEDCATCGNGVSDPGEDSTNCPEDCFCGNGWCDADESVASCPDECRAVAVAASDDHDCVVLADGSARCWGSNHAGQLGNGSAIDEDRPVAAKGLTGVVAITALGGSTCALVNDGRVWCWGAGFGLVPVLVPGLDVVVAISWTSALLADGTVRSFDASGPGSDPVGGLTGVVVISEGGRSAVLSDGTAWCDGALVAGLTDVVDISAWHDDGCCDPSGTHCAALGDGTVWCWGEGESPAPVPGLSSAVTVEATSACALLSNATVRCWSGWGGPGNGLTDVLAISHEGGFLALRADGTVWRDHVTQVW